MNKEDIKYFMAGLKRVIEHEWTTQEEFSKDVCSAVNLSNILRGNSGTSPSMRQALASKAGRSMEELITIGQYGYPVQDSMTRAQEHTIARESEGGAFTTASLAEATADEMLQMINNFISETTEHISNRLRDLAATLNLIVNERNRLAKMVQKHSTMFNSSGDAVKVVNAEHIIVDCNRAYTQQYHKYIGEHCDDDCSSCDREHCIIAQVFKTSLPERTITCSNGAWFSHMAYPIFSAMNIIDQVVVISRELDGLMVLLEEQGWVRPATLRVERRRVSLSA